MGPVLVPPVHAAEADVRQASLINLRDRTINAKIVYYGTALSGKTTSLKHVHKVIDPEQHTELVSLNTEGDRTLFFDFLPIPLGNLNGFQVKLQAFTVPGQVIRPASVEPSPPSM